MQSVLAIGAGAFVNFAVFGLIYFGSSLIGWVPAADPGNPLGFATSSLVSMFLAGASRLAAGGFVAGYLAPRQPVIHGFGVAGATYLIGFVIRADSSSENPIPWLFGLVLTVALTGLGAAAGSHVRARRAA